MRIIRMIQRSWMTLVLTISTSWFLLGSLGLSRVASIVPRVILSLTLVLLIVQLLLDLKSSSSSQSAAAGTLADHAGAGIPVDRRTPAWFVILWITILPVAIWLFGVVAGAAIFCLVFLKWYAFESWKISLAFAITLSFVLQLLFAFIFKITLYGGIIIQVLT